MIFRRIVLAAPSVAAQRVFYEELLALPVTCSTDQEVAFQVGETELVFRAAQPGTTPSYHFAFRIPGNQFTQAKRWLGERAQLLRHEGSDEVPWDFWDALAVYTHDPAGNILELLGFRGLAETEAPFSSASLLGLAELGLPVTDVLAAVALLEETFAIGLWDRQTPEPNQITPLGERGASFIIVSLGRRWFLGGRSGDYPLEIALGGVQQGELQLPSQPIHIRGGN